MNTTRPACTSPPPRCRPIPHPADTDLLVLVAVTMSRERKSFVPQARVHVAHLTLTRSPAAAFTSTDPAVVRQAESALSGRLDESELLSWLRGLGGGVRRAVERAAGDREGRT